VVYFTTIDVKPKFHDSCFGFMCRVKMAIGQWYFDSKTSHPSPNEEDNLNFLNAEILLFPCL
jgi:hypothetical protein